MKAVFLDWDSVSRGDLDLSALATAVDELSVCELAEGSIAERMRDVDIVVLNTVSLSRDLLRDAPKLKLVSIAATGTNNVDLIAAQEFGIAVCNVPTYCTASVVQHTWSLILGLTQQLTGYARVATDGTWRRHAAEAGLYFPIRELCGLSLGIVGFGQLGRSVSLVAETFGMRVLIAAHRGAAEPDPGRVALDELLCRADIVSLHCPLNDATRGMIGARELALMKPNALLINTARGALVDSAALAAALEAGRLGGAGIDVLPREPPEADEPLLEPGVPNLIVTPHVGWSALEARQRCIDETAANITDFRTGGRRGRVV